MFLDLRLNHEEQKELLFSFYDSKFHYFYCLHCEYNSLLQPFFIVRSSIFW